MSAKYTLLPDSDVEQGPVFDYRSPFEYHSFTSSNYKSIYKYKPSANSACDPNDNRQEYGSSFFFMSFTCLSYLFMILTAPVSLWFCIKIIPRHEKLIVFRLGRVHSVRGPGCVVLLPCIENWHKIDTRTRAFYIPPQQLITVDGAIVELGADVQFRIANVLLSVLRVKNLNETFRMLSRGLFLNALCKKELNQLLQERPLINQELVDSFNDVMCEWGIKVECIELSHITVLKQSEPSCVLKNLLSGCQALPQQKNVDTERKSNLSPNNKSVVHNMLNCLAKSSSSGYGIGDTDKAVIKLEVLGANIETFFICFDKSETSVHVESDHVCRKADVRIRISEKDLLSILNHELSPLQAYIGGLIETEGNVQLLMKFEMAMQSLPKQLPKSPVIVV